MKPLLYFQQLSDLGKYRIFRFEDYEDARKDREDLSYYEYIKVRDSQSEKGFPVPSNISKYSSTHLILYLKDHKRSWTKISRILGKKFHSDSEEIEFIFPYQQFGEIDKILHFVKKRERKTPAREDEKQKSRESMKRINENKRHISGKSGAKINEKRLDDYLCVEVEK